MGIRSMKEGMTAAGLREPTFAPDAFFRAIFHRSPDLALKEGVSALRTASEQMSEKMSGGTSGRILSALTEHPEATIADLAEAIGVTGRTMERQLKRLQERGLPRVAVRLNQGWPRCQRPESQTESAGFAYRITCHGRQHA